MTLEELERCFDDALDAALPNPAALIFSDVPFGYQGKRDLVFALDLLNEGENECALIAGFIRDREREGGDVAHLEREAWYYLRTSIDPAWQFDDGPPSMPAAIAYLVTVLRERTAIARRRQHEGPRDDVPAEQRAALLRALRDGGRQR